MKKYITLSKQDEKMLNYIADYNGVESIKGAANHIYFKVETLMQSLLEEQKS